MEQKIIIFVFFLIILLIYYYLETTENYFNIGENISFHVITLSNPDRLDNIYQQENILPNIKIIKFKAFSGKDLNQDQLIQEKILDPKFKFPSTKRSNEIGCYLSHLNLLKSLKNNFSNGAIKYHIILEDDFKFVLGTDFLASINKFIAQTNFNSFDIVFLGWTLSDENKSEQIYFSENLFKFTNSSSFYGTHGYMVNSNSLDKIINLLSLIDNPIDIKYNTLYSNNLLDMYWSNQAIIESNFSLTSTILLN